MDGVNDTVSLPRAFYEIVFLKNVHVVLNRSIVNTDEFCKLIQISRPLANRKENPRAVFPAPASSDQKPEQPLELLVSLPALEMCLYIQ